MCLSPDHHFPFNKGSKSFMMIGIKSPSSLLGLRVHCDTISGLNFFCWPSNVKVYVPLRLLEAMAHFYMWNKNGCKHGLHFSFPVLGSSAISTDDPI